MIVTVTMNPAVDRTVDIDELEQGGLNRVSNSVIDAGGKGINVSKTIKALGGKSIATGFIGGNTGNQVKAVLKDMGIQEDFVTILGETRTNLKIVEKNGNVTEINESGPVITEEEREELERRLLQYARKNTLFVFAGSIPNGLPPNIYQDLIQKVKEKGSAVFLDADGLLFSSAIHAIPTIIKPNRKELQEYFHLEQEVDKEKMLQLGKQFLEIGVQMAVISMGEKGALFLQKEYSFEAKGLVVKTHSTVGAGDAMVAALSYGWDCNMDTQERIKLAMAVSAGAVTTIGTKPPEKELIDKLKSQVEVCSLTM